MKELEYLNNQKSRIESIIDTQETALKNLKEDLEAVNKLIEKLGQK